MKAVAVISIICCLAVSHAAVHTQLRTQARGFVRALAFDYRLRICNAYPSEQKLVVAKGKEDLTKEGALAYKSCEDFKYDLKSGDKLDFKYDGSEAGSFTITDLPQNDATLLLVIHRHDVNSATVSFESHVFASLANAQIAVIDSYTGESKSSVKIRDHKAGDKSRQEELRYNSVVAVNPGDYECVLVSSGGEEKSKARLIAAEKESYIVLRVGVEDKVKPFPEEIMAYPKSDESSLPQSTASSASICFAFLVVALFAQ
eukprot:gnl/MRDRNA2_/MRDRNA2_130439_c0_seq1.p1 gnl/MRDRNA2_/MRDRNA2_130439_c0~~gnl/MRDRNA2_/MRDRNA2_130439_c0_seq1.p1  ORF type:complete len:259 (-),score=68.06 gnl/MRDRNA2_/MRDRNA2_130439_c0_seq1:56-832(-)